ncbi:MAG: phosphatase PAP2 family protein [Patescibacteria group bacterium]
MLHIDEKISHKLDGWLDNDPEGQALGIFAAKYLLWAFLGAAIIVYPWINKTNEGAVIYDLFLILSALAAHLITFLLSFVVRRKRPYETSPDTWHLPIRIYTSSFPSGHATIAFAVAMFLVWYWHPSLLIAVVLYAIAAIVAIARVIVGVHYVTDVIVGAVIGTGVGYLSLRLLEKLLLFHWV